MDGRHELIVDPSRLLSATSRAGHAYSVMDNSGQANSQQMRPPSYGDLCRPPGAPPTDSSTLSAAYHSRYLASLPLSSGSSFPFFGNMFTGTLPTPPSPFRAPSAPGVGSMRQFWPPTPPPDGYGRYGMNSSLFPLFSSVSPSPDNGTYMTQGLVSRLSTAGHLSHLIDNHKDQGFFSSGFSLGTPLTPSSHVTQTTPFSHLIPPLEKHPNYGHMTLGTKELEEVRDANELHATKAHLDCCKSDIPFRYSVNGKSKADNKHCDKNVSECRKSSPSYMSKEKQEDFKPLRKADPKYALQSPSKVSPCEIDVTCSTSIKPDILSPPIDSPKSDILPSPNPSLRKQATTSPYQVSSPAVSTQSALGDKPENQCSTCVANSKGLGIAAKLQRCNARSSSPSLSGSETLQTVYSQGNHATVVSTWSTTTPKLSAPETTSTCFKPSSEAAHPKETVCNYLTPRCSPVKPESPVNSNPVFQDVLCSSSKAEAVASKPTVVSAKHVTAAVIPTAPKQNVQRELVPQSLNPTVIEGKEMLLKPALVDQSSEAVVTAKKPSILHEIKSEAGDICAGPSNTEPESENLVHPSATNCCKYSNKNTSLCKVKDMIRAIDCSQKEAAKPSPNNAPFGEREENFCQAVALAKSVTSAGAVATATCSPVQASLQNRSGTLTTVIENNKSRFCSVSTELPTFKAEVANNPFDCQFSQNSSTAWTKATVSPFNWQKSLSSSDDHQQAINLTTSRKIINSEPTEHASRESQECSLSSATPPVESTRSTTAENMPSNTGIIGVCHPNTKAKTVSVASSVNKFSSLSVTAQPEITTEVHVSMKTSLQTVRHNSTPPTTCMKNNLVNSSFHSKTLKSERLTAKRGKMIGDAEKVLPNGRSSNLATLAPKLTKKVGFLKDGKSSHTLSTSSSMSSTSIVFPASVNPCIPVGIAIAQQRQDSSTASIGKPQSSVPSATSGIITSTTHLTSNRVATEIQPSQEITREQKPQDIGCSSSSGTTDSTNFLVTQGPTIVSRQWESEAVTRATLPSPWVTHGPVVAPALWIGQGAYATAAAAPASTAVPPPAPVNSLETSPISLPPGGYQLARDSVTGHLFLIPAANIVDRASVWPSYNSTPSSTLPIQQLVTQQHHTQFEQVLPQVSEQDHVQDCLSLSVRQTQMAESAKDLNSVDSCCLSNSDSVMNSTVGFKQHEQHGKVEEKSETSNNVPSVPLASGQTFTFTTFPTNCDPSGYSYVLQSSTVMHLAHTQTTASIQTESGKRSQGTSPLHSATPSPPLPSSASMHAAEDDGDEESDNDNESVACAELTQVKLSHQSQSVTTAIQVDMDLQTNSEAEEEEELDVRSDVASSKKVEMSDSANQTESILSDSAKCEFDSDSVEDSSEDGRKIETNDGIRGESKLLTGMKLSIEDKATVKSEPAVEIIMTEAELAPSLPVESKPVMDFIDHHGLNLLVDSIEEFASREKDSFHQYSDSVEVNNAKEARDSQGMLHNGSVLDPADTKQKDSETPNVAENVRNTALPYRTIDTSCTDGLGLLCALAEQRFFEESLNTENTANSKTSVVANEDAGDYHSISYRGEQRTNANYSDDPGANCNATTNSTTPFPQFLQDPFDMGTSSADLHACEIEMRKRLADLQREYKEKKLELARLMPKINNNSSSSDDVSNETQKTKDHAHKQKDIISASRFKRRTVVSRKHRTCYSFKVKAGQRLLSNRVLSKKSIIQQKKFRKRCKPMAADGRQLQQQAVANQKRNFSVKEPQVSPNKKEEIESKLVKTFSKSGKIGTNMKSKLSSKSCSSEQLVSKNVQGNEKTKINDSERKQKHKSDSKHEIICKKPLKKRNLQSDAKHSKSLKTENFHSDSPVKKEGSQIKEYETDVSDHNSSKNEERPKVPFFDEQAWFVRRSERIFLSDARPPVQATPSNPAANVSKKSILPQITTFQKSENAVKEKKEASSKLLPKSDLPKPISALKAKEKGTSLKKFKDKISSSLKSKSVDSSPLKRRHSSESSVYSKSSEMFTSSSTDGDSSDENSSQSDDLPLSMLVEQAAVKNNSLEKSKRPSTDSDSSDVSSGSGLSEDIPLSMLLAQSSVKEELKSCILTPSELQDKTRVLILDEGLFYAGHIVAVQAPDVYGIILDGERAHRPHIFSREEILNAALLEVKPTHTSQLSEGYRICAYWSQQYRCLYPGTVTKASSPLPDASLICVEFDDGDSGRIPLEDIRMLPADFPIVSMEPNPLLILGKRRARSDKENSNEQKNQSIISHKGVKEPLKLKKKRIDSAGNRIVHDFMKNELQQSPAGSKSLKAGSITLSQLSIENKMKFGDNSEKMSRKDGKIKTEESKKRNRSVSSGGTDSSISLKPKKHKKHKDDHKHHHHHHHHRHHHHKKHRSDKQNYSSECNSSSSFENAVMSAGSVSSEVKAEQSDSLVPSSSLNHSWSREKDQIVTMEKKSELTVKIKTSPSPHTMHDHESTMTTKVESVKLSVDHVNSSSSANESDEDKSGAKQKKKVKKRKASGESKPAKRKDRLPSVEKSKIAAFLPVRQLWRWSGKSYRRPGAKGKAKKEFYRAIQRGKEMLRVGDSAVFLSTGRPHLPYIGRIETMWESWGGKMDVKVKWFYHPEETKNGKKLTQLKGALFQSPHFDENDVQTISHKCEVLCWEEYQARKAKEGSQCSASGYSSLFDNNDTYYLAGTYDPITGSLTMEPGVPKIPTVTSSDA